MRSRQAARLGIGFMLGIVRVLLIVPRLDETAAVILETPVMLTASWFVCRWSVDRVDVLRTVPVRSAMGAVAFVTLMVAEFGLAGLVFSRSGRRSAHRTTPPWSLRSSRLARQFAECCPRRFIEPPHAIQILPV
jgi:hypothetical protein